MDIELDDNISDHPDKGAVCQDFLETKQDLYFTDLMLLSNANT